MAGRYTTPGPWNVLETFQAPVGTVSIFAGPLIDTRTGTTYSDGARKVTVSGPSGTPGSTLGTKPRTRTFKGETAWYKAEAWARDAVTWLNRWSYEGR